MNDIPIPSVQDKISLYCYLANDSKVYVSCYCQHNNMLVTAHQGSASQSHLFLVIIIQPIVIPKGVMTDSKWKIILHECLILTLSVCTISCLVPESNSDSVGDVSQDHLLICFSVEFVLGSDKLNFYLLLYVIEKH